MCLPSKSGYDLLSAGLSEENHQQALDPSIDLLARYRLLEPYREACRHTGYACHLDCASQALCGIKRIEASTILQLEQAYEGGKSNPRYLHDIFAKGRIATCLLDADDWNIDCDTSYAQGVCRVDSLRAQQNRADIQRMESFTGINICSFDTCIQAMDCIIAKAVEQGAKAFKLGSAYYRSLSFRRIALGQAQEAFAGLFNTRHYPGWKEKPITLDAAAQDFLVHHPLARANTHQHVYQIHTGTQAGNGNYPANSNPLLLSTLCMEYPQVTFSLLHTGFPFQNEAYVMAKTFKNVYLDMAWNHFISLVQSIRLLTECLDLVSTNKLFAFGGDESKADLQYAHLVLPKDHGATAFSHLVDEGWFGLDEAKAVCLRIFYTNPMRVFNL